MEGWSDEVERWSDEVERWSDEVERWSDVLQMVLVASTMMIAVQLSSLAATAQ